MLRRLILFALTTAATAGISAQTQPQVAPPVSQPIPGHLIVVYRNHIVPANAAQIVDALRSSATLTTGMKEPQLNFAATLALP